ncbi:MAG: energy-coupling factor transporter ATPase [Firmicutes bacterium]|nr:energy-coupling factor transporter ATPase [Bacillota bacterium]
MEIKFENVSYSYLAGTPLQVDALKDINLTIEANKINALVGPSGSGKSTLIELINGLKLPTKGTVYVGEHKLKNNIRIVNANKLRFEIGFVFQNPEDQFFQKTVKKEIQFGMKYFGYKTDKINQRVEDALKMVGLDNTYASRNPFELSGGEKRKVAIASVLAFNPDVIVLDEPTNGLDTTSKESLVKLIKTLKEKYNKTIIVVSHDVDVIYKFVDNVIILSNGKVLFQGDKYSVFKNIDILTKNGVKVPRIVEFLHKTECKTGKYLGDIDNVEDLTKEIIQNV